MDPEASSTLCCHLHLLVYSKGAVNCHKPFFEPLFKPQRKENNKVGVQCSLLICYLNVGSLRDWCACKTKKNVSFKKYTVWRRKKIQKILSTLQKFCWKKSFSRCTFWYCKIFLPETCEDTVKSVMTPKVTLAGTQSTSIQKETQEIATIKIDGK